jgi:hypothetical protein
MTPVRPEREGGVPQAAQVPYFLAISSPLKLRLLQDGFLELRVRHLTLRQGLRAAEHGHSDGCNRHNCPFHIHPVWEGGIPSTALPRMLTADQVRSDIGLRPRFISTDADDHLGVYFVVLPHGGGTYGR